MCVLAVAWQAGPRWRLVVAANRDERHDRATAPLARWPGEDLIAGRDLEAGGTWLGISAAGRFAALTNLRGLGDKDPALASRGRLVHDLLVAPATILSANPAALAGFNPFNAVSVGPEGAFLLSNRPGCVRRILPPGIHALSNGPLDPPWRKTERLRHMLREWIADPAAPRERLFAMLRDPDPPHGSEDDPANLFVLDPVYGTRCSTVVLVDAAGAGIVAERRFDPQGHATAETSLSFRWP